MDSVNVNVQYRPIRIGWCIRKNNLEDYKKALQLSHTLWGGRYNPIIPVDDIVLAGQLINVFKVDLLFPIANVKCILDFIEKFPHLPWPFIFDKQMFIDWTGSKFKEPVFLDIYQAALCFKSELKRYGKEQKIQLVEWQPDDPLSNVFHAMFGSCSLPEGQGLNFDYKELLESTLSVEKINLYSNDIIPPCVFDLPNINSLTTYNLLSKLSIGWSTPGFYIGDSNNFDDLINFWNFRACGILLFFYDPNIAHRFNDFTYFQIQKLSERTPESYENDVSIGFWGRQEIVEKINKEQFNHTKCINRIIYIQDTLWNGLSVQSSNCHFNDKSILASISTSANKTISFQLPEKPFGDRAIGSLQYLVSMINVYWEISSEKTFSLPYIPELNLFYASKLYQPKKIRVESDGVGIIIKNNQPTMSLTPINIYELTQKIFENYGMSIILSEPGLKAIRVSRQFGSLQDCKVFKIKGVRDLIKKYGVNQSFTRSAAEGIIFDLSDFNKKYKDLFLESRPINTDLTPGKVFNYLLSKGIFRCGIELKCPSCSLKFWRALDDIKSISDCEYCSESFNILTQLKDQNWQYRRSGIFGLDDNQDGAIPVVLTLQQLIANVHPRTFLYITATKITFNDKRLENGCESDFICITMDHFGKIAIILSECKTNGIVEEKDIKNLTTVMDAFPPEVFDTYLLLAKLQDFSKEEIQHAAIAQGKYHSRVIMLTARELEPWFIYEETEKLFQINKHESNWENMANNTKAIFFDKVKKN